MIYYRIALKSLRSSNWQWNSTKLTSLNALFDLIRTYRSIPKNRIRVFFSSSVEAMNEMLQRENTGKASNSITVEQLLQNNMKINTVEMRRLEAELDPQRNCQGRVSVASTRQLAHNKEQHCRESVQAAMEAGEGGDHDVPYTFALPIFMPEVLAWTKLLAKVRRGELEP